jgi:glycosyltransferase involved in cell wall biosynthesis
MASIVIIGPAYPYRGGNALFVTHLFRMLQRRFDVTLINYSLLYPSFLFPGTTQYDRSEKTDAVPNHRWVNSINPWTWWRTARKINRLNPDLIVLDWWNPFFGPCHFGIAWFLTSALKKRILVVTENVISHEGRWIDKMLTAVGLRQAAAFLCLSQTVESDLQRIRGLRKVYRSELPIYDIYEKQQADGIPVRSSLGIPSSAKVILFFGYIRAYKGLDVLIKAFGTVRKRLHDAVLLIVGESYEPIERYRSLIRETDIESGTVLVDRFVANEEVASFYESCDVVVLPYREATQSGILNIAYGCLKPVIVTRVGGLTEFVDDEKTGLIVPPESPDALADAIVRFFDLRERVPFADNIRRRVAANAFEKLPELFHLIIQDRHAA